MIRRAATYTGIILISLTVSCSNIGDGVYNGGPRLVSDVTLEPITPAPTLPFTPTVTQAPTQTDMPSPAPTETAAEFAFITPTLPPTKTPTLTPTVSDTPAPSPTPFVPTAAPAIQQDPILVPTFVVLDNPPTLVPAAPQPTAVSPSGEVAIQAPGLVPDQPRAACSGPQWFFQQPPLPDCPPNPPVVSDGSFQPFEDGFMVWVGSQQAIYVLYISSGQPRWQVFPDTFDEASIPEYDPAMNQDISPYNAWQPRRGFGMVWRSYPDVRERIGWAKSEWEAAYTVQVQIAADGTLYISEPEPRGGVFQLFPNGTDWARHRR